MCAHVCAYTFVCEGVYLCVNTCTCVWPNTHPNPEEQGSERQGFVFSVWAPTHTRAGGETSPSHVALPNCSCSRLRSRSLGPEHPPVCGHLSVSKSSGFPWGFAGPGTGH